MTNNEIIKAFIESQIKKPEKLKYDITDDVTLEVEVYPVIPFTKRAEMIREVINMAFVNGNDTIFEYTPEYTEFAIRWGIVSYYTNFKLPKNVNDVWLVLNDTSLYDDVVHIVGSDIGRIIDEINAGIDARVEYFTHKTDLNALLHKASAAVESFTAKIKPEDIERMVGLLGDMPTLSVEGVLEAVKDLQTKMKDNTKSKPNIGEMKTVKE